jgi:hypothetical protein
MVRFAQLGSWIGTGIVLLLASGSNLMLPVIGTHHGHACDHLSPVDERNPCHRAMDHIGEAHCEHAAHMSVPKDDCELCDLLASCFTQPLINWHGSHGEEVRCSLDRPSCHVAAFIVSDRRRVEARGPPLQA